MTGGEVTAAKGFNAGGMYDGLRASEEKPDLGIVTCDVDAVPAGSKLVMFVVLKWKNVSDFSVLLIEWIFHVCCR